MQSVVEWLEQSCLTLKTKGMFFSKNKGQAQTADILFKNESIDIVTDFKYLGFILDPNFNFKKHIKKMTKRNSLQVSYISYKTFP